MRLAFDVGGTFTDIALRFADGRLWTTKVPTQAMAPEEAFRAVLAAIPDSASMQFQHVLHASTLATNALLEGKLARVGLLTTRGFRDVLQLRRLKREAVYSLGWRPAPAVVPRDRIFEVQERLGADGSVVTAISDDEMARVAEWVAQQELESIAICLLHSAVDAVHERLLRDYLRQRTDVPLTISSDVDPVPGEYERTSTTVIHAALKPVLSMYLARIDERLKSHSPDSALYVMQSNGGLAASDQVIAEPARSIESGPAAGVLFAARIAATAGIRRAISFDMGGTTAKACLIEDGNPAEAPALWVGDKGHFGEGFRERGGYIVRGQTIDLVEVGAGGGSICRLDSAGVLHVGPNSAGADPGPAAYDRGGRHPTVTDADLVLGILEPGASKSGISLDLARARTALEQEIAGPLGISVEDAAWLVFEVANSNIRRAIEAVSSDRGRDPGEFTLISFGGAGPTHAAAIAAALAMREIVIPQSADAFSAAGLHECEVRRDFVHSLHERVDRLTVEHLDEEFDELIRRIERGDDWPGRRLERLLDVCFVGQRNSLSIALPDDLDPATLHEAINERFRSAHLRIYGHSTDDAELELTAVRLRLSAGFAGAPPKPPERDSEETRTNRVYFGPRLGWVECARVGAHELGAAARPGPILVQLGQATAVIPPGATVVLDEEGHLRMSMPPAEAVGKSLALAGRAALDLFRNALGAVVDRMAYTVARTAFSALVSDSHDFSVAICDSEGRVAYQGLGVLIHLSTLASALEAVYRSNLVPLREGDVIVLNDPYHGGTHLPDFVVIVPVFIGKKLVAHTVAIAHMIDVGGVVSGSFSSGAGELRQEGIIIPPIRLYEGGHLNRAVLDVLRRNIRQPEEVVGDIESLVAAAKLGAGRLVRLGEDMGTGSLLASIADIISYATERGRHEIEGLGTAEAEFVDYLDDDHVSEEPVRIKVHLRIANGQVNCDFSGSSHQVNSGLNSVVGTTRSVVQWAIRTQMSEDFPDNHGFYSLVTLKTEPGTVVDARDDAPVAGRALTAFRVGDAIMGALAQMFPGRIPAIGDGSMNPLTFGGRRDDGTTFVAHDVLGGNTGGGPHADGTEGVAPAIGNARNVSVELLEAYAPVRVVRYGFKPDTGGRGRYRGGNSIVREYELLCDEAEVYIRNDRQKFPPWGLEGGGSGKPSANLLVRAGGELETLPSKFVFRMRRGDRLTWLGPGGGGYGDPAERDPVETERDRREGRFVDG